MDDERAILQLCLLRQHRAAAGPEHIGSGGYGKMEWCSVADFWEIRFIWRTGTGCIILDGRENKERLLTVSLNKHRYNMFG